MKVRIPRPQIERFAPQVYQCRRATEPLLLDGRLDKPFWRDAPWTADFVDIEGDRRPKPRFRTRAKMLWDDSALYIGAELWGDELWAYVTERDDVIFRDNDFEVFLDPDGDSHLYAELELNARNTVWDLLLHKPYRDGGRAIDSFDIKGLQTAVRIDGELNNPAAQSMLWSCEIVIPHRSLQECQGKRGGSPMPGEYWRINFSRVQWQVDVVDGQFIKRAGQDGKPLPEDNWVWSAQGIINMHYPELWGFLFFCDGQEDYEVPADEHRKWQLRQLYYDLHAAYDAHGHFPADLPKPNGFRLQVTNHGFEIACPAVDGRGEWVMGRDGEVKRIR